MSYFREILKFLGIALITLIFFTIILAFEKILEIKLNIKMPLFDISMLTIFGTIMVLFFISIAVEKKRLALIDKVSSDRIKKAEEEAQNNPFEAGPQCELAQTKLEAYLNRNLLQMKNIFNAIVIAMLIGFALMIFGIYKAFMGEQITPAIISTCTGVITEFIAATFLIVYRSTVSQANNFVKTLEKMNKIGISIRLGLTHK